jgi:glycosyltransferase involved in cell wall biosynthesis
MRIGIDASRLTVGKRTGTENYSLNVIRELSKIAPAQLVLYFNQPPALPLIEELDLPSGVALKSLPFPRLWTHYRLSREMLFAAPDVLFIPAHVLPLVHPRHSVVTLHDVGYLYHPEAHTPRARRYLDFSTRFSARAARRVIAVSQATKHDLMAHYAIPPERIAVINHGYDKIHFQPITDPEKLRDVRTRYRLGDYRFLFYVGTLQPRKNLVRLLDAFERLAREPEFSDLRLVLGGKPGWLSEPILQRAAKLRDKVILPGYVKDEDLPALYSAASAFVFPSLYEGFGMPVLEALACGCPVVCSNSSSLPEVGGDAALYHHPLDTDALEHQLRRVLTQSDLVTGLRKKGFAQAERFSWEKCARETLNVLTIDD